MNVALLVFLLSGAVSTSTTASRVLTLEEAIAIAHKNHPQVIMARAAKNAAEARVGQAFSQYLPQVMLDPSTNFYQRGTANFVLTPSFQRSLFSRPEFTLPPNEYSPDFNYYSVGVTARVPIYDFGRTSGQVEAARALARSAKEDSKIATRDVELNVRTSYYAVLAAQSLLKVAEEALANQKRHLEQISAYVQAGTRPKIDLPTMEVEVANAELQQLRARQNLSLSRVVLHNAIGLESEPDYEVVAPGEETPLEARPLAELLRAAESNRSELSRMREQLIALEERRSSIRANHFPFFVGSISGSAAGTDFPPTPNWNLMVSLGWPIFTGFNDTKRIEETDAEIERLAAQTDSIRLSLKLEVERVYLAVKEAAQRIAAVERAVVAAGQRLELAEGRYSAGVGSIIELGDAELALAQARGQQVQAIFDLQTTRAQLKRAIDSEGNGT